MPRKTPPAEETAAPLPSAAEQLGEITVEIDTAKLKVADLRFLARARRGEIKDEEALDFLNRVVVGGVEELPYDALPQIWAAVFQTVYGGKKAKN